MKYHQIRRDELRHIAIFLVLGSTISMAGGIFLSLMYWPIGLIIWLLFVTLALFLGVQWHSRNFAYNCSLCGHVFEISVFTNLISPHFLTKKYLRCPSCNKRMWADIVKRGNAADCQQSVSKSES